MGQNARCRSAASAASALSAAFGCTSISGMCRQTYRRSPKLASSAVRRARPGRSRGTRSDPQAADVVVESPSMGSLVIRNQWLADREASVGNRPVDTSRWATSPILVWVSRAARRSLSKAVIAST